MSARRIPFLVSAIAALAVLAITSGVGPGASAAEPSPSAEQEVRLRLRPADTEEAFYDLTAAPGDELLLNVEIGNLGSAALIVESYPADVFSLINGGMGVRLRSEATSGATGWLAYDPEQLTLEPGSGVTRHIAVNVPADAKPGEYVSALVVEPSTPVEIGSGHSGLRQIPRHAMAVVITVPGPHEAALETGGMEHRFVGGRSLVQVDIANIGNASTMASASILLTDSAGEQQEHRMPLDRIFADTETQAEFLLEHRLPRGIATVELTLTTEDGAHSMGSARVLVGDVPVAGAVIAPTTIATTSGGTDWSLWTMLMVSGGSILAAICGYRIWLTFQIINAETG